MPELELQEVLAKGYATDNNYIVAKDKTVTWVSGESILVKNDEGEASILKVIQIMDDEKKLEASVQYNDSILASIEDVVIVLDERLNVLKANKTFTTLFKYNWNNEKVNFETLIKPFDLHRELRFKILNTLQTKKGFLTSRSRCKHPIMIKNYWR